MSNVNETPEKSDKQEQPARDVNRGSDQADDRQQPHKDRGQGIDTGRTPDDQQ